VHVSDLAQAHLKALLWLLPDSGVGIHEAFNLGSGTGNSVKQIIAETTRLAGRDVPHSIGPRRPGDSPKLVGDITKARRELGWQPTRDLATQIEDTLRWRRKMPR
jgi:UDP-glucose 4-epimerase